MSAKSLLPGIVLLVGCGGPDSGTQRRISPEELRVSTAPSGLPLGTVSLPDGRRITVELAATNATRNRGLMFRESLPDDYGMLFVFGGERSHSFWMKNTLMNLDMIFIGKDRRITVIHRDVPRSTLETPEDKVAKRTGFGRFVLELPAGASRRYGLKKGQRLGFGG
ncbi:MAG: DUF192 domain-containing protein [Elusimicrobiota bacterium]